MKPVPFGRYLLYDRLAIGGMAEVYVAKVPGALPARPYALKRLLPTLAADEELVAMFLDEARLGAHLAHPGIAAIHDAGRHGDAWYIAREYVPGADLRALLARARELGEGVPPPLAAFIVARVADALDAAHRARDGEGVELHVVHRDVSPANVLVGFDGGVRVIDFGIAQAAFRARRDEAVPRGKLGYLSPEAVRGEPVDRRSDVFALGVVLHELLAGARLFVGPSRGAVLARVRAAELPPPSRLNPAVPAALDAVVLRALARDPAARFPWAGELRDALAPFLGGAGPPGDASSLASFVARLLPAELRAEEARAARLLRG